MKMGKWHYTRASAFSVMFSDKGIINSTRLFKGRRFGTHKAFSLDVFNPQNVDRTGHVTVTEYSPIYERCEGERVRVGWWHREVRTIPGQDEEAAWAMAESTAQKKLGAGEAAPTKAGVSKKRRK